MPEGHEGMKNCLSLTSASRHFLSLTSVTTFHKSHGSGSQIIAQQHSTAITYTTLYTQQQSITEAESIKHAGRSSQVKLNLNLPLPGRCPANKQLALASSTTTQSEKQFLLVTNIVLQVYNFVLLYDWHLISVFILPSVSSENV